MANRTIDLISTTTGVNYQFIVLPLNYIQAHQLGVYLLTTDKDPTRNIRQIGFTEDLVLDLRDMSDQMGLNDARNAGEATLGFLKCADLAQAKAIAQDLHRLFVGG